MVKSRCGQAVHIQPQRRLIMPKTKTLTTADQPLSKRVDIVIAYVLGVAPEKINDDAHFVDDLDADSLDCVEMMVAMETEFNIDIHDDDAESVSTVGQLKRYIGQALSDKAA